MEQNVMKMEGKWRRLDVKKDKGGREDDTKGDERRH